MALFCLVAALLYADQNLMAPNLTQIAEDFGFNAVVRTPGQLETLHLLKCNAMCALERVLP